MSAIARQLPISPGELAAVCAAAISEFKRC